MKGSEKSRQSLLDEKMGFQIKQPEKIRQSINRTIRFRPEMFERLTELAEENKISFNFLVCQCVQYALDNLEK